MQYAAAAGGVAESKGESSGEGSNDQRCPWSIQEVESAESSVDDAELAACIQLYADSEAGSVFRDRFNINGVQSIQQRGREAVVRYYKDIERACNPFLPAMEGARRRADCAQMERENKIAAKAAAGAGKGGSHGIAVRCLGQIEETLRILCIRNNVRGRAQGLAAYAQNLHDNGQRISPGLLDRLKAAAQFRNINLGHEAEGAGQGITVSSSKTASFLRLYCDLLQESARVPPRVPDPTREYPISEVMPRGIALILNVLKKRPGAEKDGPRLVRLFESLCYDVRYKADPTDSDVMEEFRKAENDSRAASEAGMPYDSFVCVIAAHGSRSTFSPAKGARIELDRLFKRVGNLELDVMSGKPKLFFVNACRGSGEDRGVVEADEETGAADGKDDDFNLVASDADLLIAYSTTDGKVSWRNNSEGSWYLQTLCDVIEDRHEIEHVLDLVTEVNNRINDKAQAAIAAGGSGRQVQCSPSKSTLRKKFYFCAGQERAPRPSDRNALLSFYKAMGGDEGYLGDKWDFSQPIDNTWEDITCDEANGRVVKMDFSNESGLEGLFAMLLDLEEGNLLLRGRGCCLIFAELEEGRQRDACVRPQPQTS